MDDAGEHDIFKDHVAKWEKHGPHLETLEWKKPGSSIYAIWYVRQYGVLMVFGDCYEATYMWSWDGRITLQWIAGLNEGYFLSKCRASPHGRSPYVYDDEQMHQDMKDYFADGCTRNEPRCPEGECECCDGRRKEEKLFEEHNGWGHMEDEFTWVSWLRENGDDVFGYDWWESVPSGKKLGACIKLHLEGLKAAFESLKKDTL